MKKILTIIITLMVMCVQSVMAQYPKIMLQHEGKATLFETTALQEAVDASVDGDTIYIPEGPYNSSAITITKKISIIGQGEKSVIGNVTINLPGDSELSSTLLYGLKTGNVTISSSSTNLHIDKCNIYQLFIHPKSSTTTKTYVLKDLIIERTQIREDSYISTSGYDEYENCIFRNCKFEHRWYVDSPEITCINCEFVSDIGAVTGSSSGSGIFMNSIIKGYVNSSSSSRTFVNCLMKYEPPSVCDCTNIYVDNNTNYTDEELEAKGYLGTDGTIVGPNGGSRPFNLVPSVPSLVDIRLDVNYNTKKLNVTVKVQAN